MASKNIDMTILGQLFQLNREGKNQKYIVHRLLIPRSTAVEYVKQF